MASLVTGDVILLGCGLPVCLYGFALLGFTFSLLYAANSHIIILLSRIETMLLGTQQDSVLSISRVPTN